MAYEIAFVGEHHTQHGPVIVTDDDFEAYIKRWGCSTLSAREALRVWNGIPENGQPPTFTEEGITFRRAIYD